MIASTTQNSKPDYLTLFRQALECGRTPPPPRTRDELIALAETFPNRLPRYLPNAEIIERWELTSVATPPRPFGRSFCDKLLATVDADPEFAGLLSYVLRRAG